MAADDDKGLLAAYARFVVRRSCLSFWLSLLGSFLLIMFGMMITIADARSKGQSGILSEQTEYDWTVTGAKLMKHKDMVDDALDRRDSYAEVSAVAEREDEFEHRYSFNFLYYWEDGREADIWTAENLQTMCEVENIVYSTPGYERFCLNASTVPSLSALGHLSTHAMHSSSNATSGATCSLPPMSAVSVFYQDFDPAAATPSVQPLLELFYGSHLGEAPHAAAPQLAPRPRGIDTVAPVAHDPEADAPRFIGFDPLAPLLDELEGLPADVSAKLGELRALDDQATALDTALKDAQHRMLEARARRAPSRSLSRGSL